MSLDLSLESPLLQISASAGTGKTHQLIRRYVALLADHVEGVNSIDQILATTFTRKAAGEIMGRVLLELANAAQDEAKANALSKDIQPADGSRCIAFSQQIALGILGQLLRGLHRMRICTLDSFFAQLAKGFSLEMGMPPGWRMLEEHQLEQFRLDAVNEVLSKGFDNLGDGDGDKGLFTLIQLLTKGETSRSVHDQINDTVKSLHELYVETGDDPWLVLKAPGGKLEADQLGIAIEQLVEAGEYLPLKKDGSPTVAGLKAHGTAIENAMGQDWPAFLAKGFAKKLIAGDYTFYKQMISDELVSAYQPLLDHACAVEIGKLISQSRATCLLLHQFDKVFTQIKHRAHAFHFGDVTRQLARMTTADHLQTMFYRIDGVIQHFLFDEFQDTSRQQWQVLRPMVVEVGSQPGGTHSLFVVGDTKQAIYAWRGGVAEIFKEIEKDVQAIDNQKLDVSYRSRPAIINVVNKLFQNMPSDIFLDQPAGQHEINQWGASFPLHSTAKDETPGRVVMKTVGTQTDSAEAHEIAAFGETVALVHRLTKENPKATIGILLRKNKSISRLMYMLRQLDPPIETSDEGGVQLHLIPAVASILSLMQVADHPSDTIARFHLATSPLGAVLDFTDYDDDQRANQLATQIRSQLIEQGYGPTLHEHVAKLAPDLTSSELDRMHQLVELAHQFQPYASLRPGEFTKYVQLMRVEDPSAARVRVMTVHKAKGLQFDIVILPELNQKLTGQPPGMLTLRENPIDQPHIVTRYMNEDLRKLAMNIPSLAGTVAQMYDQYYTAAVRESLNLLYVAMTRASFAMYMFIPPARASEKKLPKTFAGLLRGSIVPEIIAEEGVVLYDAGDANWYAVAEQNMDGQKVDLPAVQKSVVLAARTSRQRALLRQSPSQLAAEDQVNLADMFTLKGEAARTYGDQIHKLFESIEWLDILPERQAVLDDFKAHQLSSEEAQTLVDQFLAVIAKPKIIEVLHPKRYAHLSDEAPDVYLEMPFIMRTKSTLLNGRCDRVVVVCDEEGVPIYAEIIDYKTDRIDVDDMQAIDERVKKYTAQMKAYRSAVAKRFHLSHDKIVTTLLFVTANLVVDVQIKS